MTIQAQILDLMRKLQKETGTAIILITHDLGVVAEMCDRVAVMYAGEIVEQTDVKTLFAQPLHPYTQGLIGFRARAGRDQGRPGHHPGQRAEPDRAATGLPLRAALRRADRARQRPRRASIHPELREVTPSHVVRCWLYHTLDGGRRADPSAYPDAPAELRDRQAVPIMARALDAGPIAGLRGPEPQIEIIES